MTKLITIESITSATDSETAWIFVVEDDRIMWGQYFTYFGWETSCYEGELYSKHVKTVFSPFAYRITEEILDV